MAGEHTDADVSFEHDLRNGIGGLLGLMQLLADPDPTLEKPRIAHCAQETCQVLHRMLEARIGAATASNNLKDSRSVFIDVAATMGAVAQRFEPWARLKHLRLHTEFDHDLPRSVPGDPDLFYRVLVNLVENALQATASGTVTIAARHFDSLAEANGNPPHLLIEVRDTGAGMAPDTLAALFIGPAPRSAASLAAPTHGIGLPSVARMLAQLRSHLMVETSTGRGSRFFFALPLPLPPC